MPACTYGRVGRCACRRRPGGGGAGGGLFGAGVFFSGGGAPWGSTSTRTAGWSSRPGVALEFLCFPPDPRWRRIWRPETSAGRASQLLPAADPKAAVAKRRGDAGGTSALAVHRQELRRGAAERLGGVSQGIKCSQAVARWRSLLFVFIAGVAAVLGASSGFSSTYFPFRTVFLLCTVYVVLW